jgi:hypothetical protein
MAGEEEGVGKKLIGGGLQAALDVVQCPFDSSHVFRLPQAPLDLSSIEQKLDRLIELDLGLGNSLKEIIDILNKLLAKQTEIGLSVLTPWVAGEPEKIYDEEIRAAGTFYSYHMVDFRNGKRLIFKVDSTLDQGVIIQAIGNIVDDRELATNINGPWPCGASSSISIGLNWGDWHGYVGIRITVAAAPTLGRLSIWDVIQK